MGKTKAENLVSDNFCIDGISLLCIWNDFFLDPAFQTVLDPEPDLVSDPK
jgi:hypothetical protein